LVVVIAVENGLREGRNLSTAGSGVKTTTDAAERHDTPPAQAPRGVGAENPQPFGIKP